MGVNRSDYILIGSSIDIKTDDNFYEDNEDFFVSRKNVKKGQLVYLEDNYSGEYFVIGKVVKVDAEGYNGLGLNEFPLDIENFKEYALEVKEHVKDKFGKDIESKFIVLTHYS